MNGDCALPSSSKGSCETSRKTNQGDQSHEVHEVNSDSFSFSSASSDEEFFHSGTSTAGRRCLSKKRPRKDSMEECNSVEEEEEEDEEEDELELPFGQVRPLPSTLTPSTSPSQQSQGQSPSHESITFAPVRPPPVTSPISPFPPEAQSPAHAPVPELKDDDPAPTPNQTEAMPVDFSEGAPQKAIPETRPGSIFQHMASILESSKSRHSGSRTAKNIETQPVSKPSDSGSVDSISLTIDCVTVESPPCVDSGESLSILPDTEAVEAMDLGGNPTPIEFDSSSLGYRDQVFELESSSSDKLSASSPSWSMSSSSLGQSLSEPQTPVTTGSSVSSDRGTDPHPVRKKRATKSVPRALACLESNLNLNPSRSSPSLPSSVPELYQDSRLLSRDQRKLQQQYLLLLSNDRQSPARTSPATKAKRGEKSSGKVVQTEKSFSEVSCGVQAHTCAVTRL